MASDEDLQFLQQLGVEWVMVGLSEDLPKTVSCYRKIVGRMSDYGLQIFRFSDHPVHNMEEVTLNLPGRDRKIEQFLDFIHNIGEAGIRYHTYAHMDNGIWTSERTGVGCGGMAVRRLDIENAHGRWGEAVFDGATTHGRPIAKGELGGITNILSPVWCR